MACLSSSRRAKACSYHPVRTLKTFAPCAPIAPTICLCGSRHSKVATHFRDRLGIIGFCGAPFTLQLHDEARLKELIHTKQ